MLALLLVSPLLGLDNFAAALSIGLERGRWTTGFQVCLVFGVYAALALLVGLAVGQALATVIGHFGPTLAGAVLVLMGLSRLIGTLRHGERGPAERRGDSLSALLVIGLAVSVDTVVAGFGLGLDGVPLASAVALIAGVTAALSLAGFAIARFVSSPLGSYGGRLSSIALAVVGVAVAGRVIS
ncbi:MAG: manganese efflux pump [Chloroflexi bacterium]|nr:manganese efflux pump [Chloroflexota bacterium]